MESEPTVRRSRSDIRIQRTEPDDEFGPRPSGRPSYAFRAPDPICGNHASLLQGAYARPSTVPDRRSSLPLVEPERLVVVVLMSAVIGLPTGLLAWLVIETVLAG